MLMDKMQSDLTPFYPGKSSFSLLWPRPDSFTDLKEAYGPES